MSEIALVEVSGATQDPGLAAEAPFDDETITLRFLFSTEDPVSVELGHAVSPRATVIQHVAVGSPRCGSADSCDSLTRRMGRHRSAVRTSS